MIKKIAVLAFLFACSLAPLPAQAAVKNARKACCAVSRRRQVKKAVAKAVVKKQPKKKIAPKKVAKKVTRKSRAKNSQQLSLDVLLRYAVESERVLGRFLRALQQMAPDIPGIQELQVELAILQGAKLHIQCMR